MKRPLTILIIIILLITSAVGIGWLYYRANPTAWDAFLADMQGTGSDSPAPAARAVARPARRIGALTASGAIEAEEVSAAVEQGGRIVTITVDEGDVVTAGETLLQLDQASLLAQRDSAAASVAQAQAARDAAQAQLDQAKAGATEEEIAVANAAVLTAQGAVAAAEANLTQANVNADSARTIKESESSVAVAEAGVGQAEGAVDLAKADLARANAELARLRAGASSEEISMYQALVNQAQSNFLYYESIHFTNFIDPGIGGAPEEQARYLREAARGARDAAQAQLDAAKTGATPEEIAAATAVVAAAQAQVTIAEAGLASAQAQLAQTRGHATTTQDNVAIADAGVAAAEAQVSIATGQLAQAEAELARLQAGATPEAIAALTAQVAQANAAVDAAQAALTLLDIELTHTTLVAPVGGIILQRLVHQGELATPGASLFTLADLDIVKLTVYVPEADLGQVDLGQQVVVTVDAYDQEFMGQVAHIASEAEFTPKNVQTQEERVHMVFAVEIRLDNPDHLLKPGMPADAVFQ